MLCCEQLREQADSPSSKSLFSTLLPKDLLDPMPLVVVVGFLSESEKVFLVRNTVGINLAPCDGPRRPLLPHLLPSHTCQFGKSQYDTYLVSVGSWKASSFFLPLRIYVLCPLSGRLFTTPIFFLTNSPCSLPLPQPSIFSEEAITDGFSTTGLASSCAHFLLFLPLIKLNNCLPIASYS